MAKITQVVKRSGTIVPFTPERITNAIYRAAVAVGGRDQQRAKELTSKVVAMLEEVTPSGHTPSVEEIQDLVEKVLVESGHAKVAKAYILYRDERARRRKEQEARLRRPSDNIPWAKVWQSLDWAVDHGVNTIDGLNQRIAQSEFAEVVAEAEAAYEVQVKEASELIAERGEEIKLAIITGPSSSGKTTTTIKLEHHLTQRGLKFATLNVDNYFFDLEMHPKDEFGDYDFETPQALDLPLINEHLKKLTAGEEIMVPFYDFKTGKRHEAQTPMRIAPNEIILIDSLHGLFGDMTQGIPDERQFKLYLEPLLQMKDRQGKYVRWTDLRLIRRMLRDSAHRAYDPRRTLEHWHYVRSSEMRNIIPYIHTTDYIINSAMPYELALYRARLFDEFAQWEQDYRDDPLREDAYTRAARVHKVLAQVTPVDDDTAIPPDSVMREFIGGSTLAY